MICNFCPLNYYILKREKSFYSKLDRCALLAKLFPTIYNVLSNHQTLIYRFPYLLLLFLNSFRNNNIFILIPKCENCALFNQIKPSLPQTNNTCSSMCLGLLIASYACINYCNSRRKYGRKKLICSAGSAI